MLKINPVSFEEISLKPYVETAVENVFICSDAQTVLFLGADNAMEVSMDCSAISSSRDNIEESNIERAIKAALKA